MSEQGWHCEQCKHAEPGSYVRCDNAYNRNKPGCKRTLSLTITDLEALEVLASMQNLPNPESYPDYLARLIREDYARTYHEQYDSTVRSG